MFLITFPWYMLHMPLSRSGKCDRRDLMEFRVIESDSIISCTASCLSAIHLQERGRRRRQEREEVWITKTGWKAEVKPSKRSSYARSKRYVFLEKLNPFWLKWLPLIGFLNYCNPADCSYSAAFKYQTTAWLPAVFYILSHEHLRKRSKQLYCRFCLQFPFHTCGTLQEILSLSFIHITGKTLRWKLCKADRKQEGNWADSYS